jgi:fatty acid desaturase
MLSAAALGMFLYGTYSTGWAVIDLIRGARLELWAEVGLAGFGVLLMLAAAFVRVRLPGGIAFAIGAMLGLQALAVHDAVHLASGIGSQVTRASIAAALVALALSDARPSQALPARDSDRTTT